MALRSLLLRKPELDGLQRTRHLLPSWITAGKRGKVPVLLSSCRRVHSLRSSALSTASAYCARWRGIGRTTDVRLAPASNSAVILHRAFVHSASRAMSSAAPAKEEEKAGAVGAGTKREREEDENRRSDGESASGEPSGAAAAGGGSSSTGGGGNHQKRKKKKNFRRKEGQPREQTVHEGSFASPEMREMFGVSVDLRAAAAAAAGDGGETNADETDEQDEAAASSAAENKEEKGESGTAIQKFPKKKIVFLIAFVGERYAGMQINAGQRTIQAELELALYRAGLISEANFGFPNKYGWSNGARTDKGVHSCAQACSAKVEMPPLSMDGVRDSINAHLPDDIRVLDVKKTTRKFCSRTQRDNARYQYMIPSFLLRDRESLRKMFQDEACHENGRLPADPLSDAEIAKLRPSLVSFRINKETLEKLRSKLAAFKGTHCFHNYTKGMTGNDASASRYIISFTAQEPVLGPDGMEWIPTQVLGQSFLLNQIRKMVSMAIDVTRGAASDDAFLESFSRKRKLQLGTAPAQGLFLDMSYFDQYNKRHCQEGGGNDPLDWAEEGTDGHGRWKEFKEGTVVKFIMEQEREQSNFLKYIFRQEFVFDHVNNFTPVDVDADGDGKADER